MTIRCPSCSVSILPREVRGEGGVVRCPSCGHGWLEAKAIEVTGEPDWQTTPATEHLGLTGIEVQHFVSASLLAQERFVLLRRRRRAAVAAWLGLATLALSPAVAAIAVPDKVVAAAPSAILLYDWLGHDVNIYGLDIRNVEMQHLEVGGQRVIAIKGEILNVSQDERKVPWLRFGLVSDDKGEVYNWQLNTQSRPLRSGEAKSFVTRVASPPASAGAVEIRFARADEIGSNTSP